MSREIERDTDGKRDKERHRKIARERERRGSERSVLSRTLKDS